MKSSSFITLSIVIILLVSVATHVALGQQSIFDRTFPTQSEVRISLRLTSNLSRKDPLTAAEILQLYSAEEKIGRVVWGLLDKDTADAVVPIISPRPCFADTVLLLQCVHYVEQNRNRFRVVWDAWKSEDNFFEPNRFWLTYALVHVPNSLEARNIEFDFDFKDLIRHVDIDEDARGKTCQQYHDEQLKEYLESYLEVYSKQEIDTWPAECDSARNDFVRAREQLLQKYKYAPFTKILRDIDPTTVVVFHSVC